MQSQNPIFDEIAKLMTNAAGAAKGFRDEMDTFFRAQAERILAQMDVVTRDEFDAVKAMALKAREEADALKTASTHWKRKSPSRDRRIPARKRRARSNRRPRPESLTVLPPPPSRRLPRPGQIRHVRRRWWVAAKFSTTC